VLSKFKTKILAAEVNCPMLIYKNIITKKLILKVKDKKGFQLKQKILFFQVKLYFNLK